MMLFSEGMSVPVLLNPPGLFLMRSVLLFSLAYRSWDERVLSLQLGEWILADTLMPAGIKISGVSPRHTYRM
jgi:hypothetical protein